MGQPENKTSGTPHPAPLTCQVKAKASRAFFFLQERIVFWAFPRNERDICMYSSMSRIPASSEEFVNSPFYRGIKLLEFGCVKEVLQVGKRSLFLKEGATLGPRGTVRTRSLSPRDQD